MRNRCWKDRLLPGLALSFRSGVVSIRSPSLQRPSRSRTSCLPSLAQRLQLYAFLARYHTGRVCYTHCGISYALSPREGLPLHTAAKWAGLLAQPRHLRASCCSTPREREGGGTFTVSRVFHYGRQPAYLFARTTWRTTAYSIFHLPKTSACSAVRAL